MNQVEKFLNGDIYLRFRNKSDYIDVLNACYCEDIGWCRGDSPDYRDGIILCCDSDKLTFMTDNIHGCYDSIPIEDYLSPVDTSKVGRTEVVNYVDKLIDYTPNQGDRYRFELYDYEYILAHVGGREFNLINMVTGNLLTSDSFELPKYGIDLIKYAGSVITHVNGNKIL